MVRDHGGGAGLGEAQFGIGVQVATPGHHPGRLRFDGGFDAAGVGLPTLRNERRNQ